MAKKASAPVKGTGTGKWVPKKGKVVAAPTIPTSTTAVLPDGTVLTAGQVLRVTGVDGVYKFKYERLGELTCWGGTTPGEKSDACWRTFRPEQIATVTANLVAEKLAAKVTATMPAEYAVMTAGQKAAYTKRMRAAQAAQAVA